MSAISYEVLGCKTNQVTVLSEPTGKKICNGNQCYSSKDLVAQKLYATVVNMLHFFQEVFGICGVNGRGLVPGLYIHWSENNAQWQSRGNQGRFRFNDAFAAMHEVVAHEYTHAVVQNFGQLAPKGEAGALNESISDVFGIAFRHKLLGDFENWVVGGNLRDLSQCINATSLKSDENVHYNSKIPSHAFYCAVQASKTPSFGVLAKIWFLALRDVSKTASFREFAISTLDRTVNSKLKSILAHSWVHVRVLHWAVPKKSLSQSKASITAA